MSQELPSFEEFMTGADTDHQAPPDATGIEDLMVSSVGTNGLDRDVVRSLERITQELEEHGYYEENSLPEEYHDQDIMKFRDVDEIVLEYTTIFTLARRRVWGSRQETGQEDWRNVVALLGYAARDDTYDVDLRVPDNAVDVIEDNMDTSGIDTVLSELDTMTDEKAVNRWRDGNGDVHPALSRSVANNFDKKSAVAAYYRGYHPKSSQRLLRESDAVAGTPQAITDGLRMNEGEWDYYPLNRLDTMRDHIDWTENVFADEIRSVPKEYQCADPADYTDVDALVLDHSTVCDLVHPRSRPAEHEDTTYNGEELLDLINSALDYSQNHDNLPVYMLDDQEEKLQPIMTDKHAQYVTEDLRAVTGTVHIDTGIPVPDEYSGMDEDYHIVASAEQQVDGTPLIVTTDNDFATFDIPAIHAGKAVDAIQEKYVTSY